MFMLFHVPVFKLLLILLFSLAVHPDKIRIATGQIAGVDKDGRVSSQCFVSAPTAHCLTC